jgi:hypothetical protein
MKANLFFPVLALLPCLASGQQVQRITGKVTDANNSLIESGYNIVLLSPQDSSIYKGDFFLDPDFSIETNQIPVLLKVSSFGYNDTTLLVQSPGGSFLDIHLPVQSFSLHEVTVSASQPMFSMRNDRITLHVEGTALSEADYPTTNPSKCYRLPKYNGSTSSSILHPTTMPKGRP